MYTMNVTESVHILNVKALIQINNGYQIYLNSFNNKFALNSIKELDEILLNLKENEFKGLDIIFSTDINSEKKEINIWVTPIVKSA